MKASDIKIKPNANLQKVAGKKLLVNPVHAISAELKLVTGAKPKSLNQRIVEQLYRLFKLRDLEGLRLILAHDIRWDQMKGFPEGKTLVGQDAVFSGVFCRLTDEWNDWKAVVENFMDAGDKIIVTGFYEGTFKATQQHAVSEFAHIYTLRNRKIVQFQQYADTALVAEAMGLMKEKTPV